MNLQKSSDFYGEFLCAFNKIADGEVTRLIEECPGVFYAATLAPGEFLGREYYFITPGAVPRIISAEVLQYGVPIDNGCYIFEHGIPRSGWELVHFEILRYLVKHGNPLEECESLYSASVNYSDIYPAYFGGVIPPRCTPWGPVIRQKMASNGVFFLETDRAEWILAVYHPIWSGELSGVAQAYGTVCDADLHIGPEEAIYLYFKAPNYAPPIFELMGIPEYSGLQNYIKSTETLEAYLTTYCPEYMVWHNVSELSGNGKEDMLKNLLKILGAPLEDTDAPDNRQQRIDNCIHYSPGLDITELLLLP